MTKQVTVTVSQPEQTICPVQTHNYEQTENGLTFNNSWVAKQFLEQQTHATVDYCNEGYKVYTNSSEVRKTLKQLCKKVRISAKSVKVFSTKEVNGIQVLSVTI